ncbi:hypothetical protein D3C72_1187500 [compost metagenome]
MAELGVNGPAIDHLTVAQGCRQRPLLQLRQGVAEVVCAQPIDAHQQCTGVVLAAAEMGGADQGLRRILQVNLFAQYCPDLRFTQAGPDTIAQQDKTLAGPQVAFQVVNLQVLIKTQRALEHMLHARLIPYMIFADALQLPGGPAIDPAVADMRQGEASATEYQGAQGGQ